MATNSFSDVNTLSFIVALIDLTQNISTSIRNLINTIPHELLINITTICILTVIFVPLFIFLTRGHSPCKIGNLKIPIWTIASSICLLINSLLLLFWASWHLDSMDKKRKVPIWKVGSLSIFIFYYCNISEILLHFYKLIDIITERIFCVLWPCHPQKTLHPQEVQKNSSSTHLQKIRRCVLMNAYLTILKQTFQ